MGWKPDDFGEPVAIKGEVVGRDSRMRPIYGESRIIEHCIVSPAGDQVVKGEDFVHGDITKLQVLAPAGTRVDDGDTVVIRGEEYVVQQLQSFDYSVGRRPAVWTHRPKVVFIVSRGEVSENVS